MPSPAADLDGLEDARESALLRVRNVDELFADLLLEVVAERRRELVLQGDQYLKFGGLFFTTGIPCQSIADGRWRQRDSKCTKILRNLEGALKKASITASK